MKAKDKLQYCGYSVSTGLKIWNDQTDLLMYFQRNQQEYSVTEVKSISQACYIYIYIPSETILVYVGKCGPQSPSYFHMTR